MHYEEVHNLYLKYRWTAWW